MGRVMTAPAAELAHLDPVRRISPRLVGLVIPALALFASQGHRDADISASHASPSFLRTVIANKNPGRKARG
jgi:hypothetical protein